MAEIEEQNTEPEIGGDELARLKDRVNRLHQELEDLDYDHVKTCEAFRAAVALLVSLCREGHHQDSVAAMDQLVHSSRAWPLIPADVQQSVDNLKQTLLKEPTAPSGQPGEKADAGAASHVALALMQGLRLGEADFDAELDRIIGEITKAMENQQVRPAMAMVVDLMDRYRHRVNRGRRKAEKALREILIEVLQTEDQLARAFHSANVSLVESSKKYEKDITSSMTELAKDINVATDLGNLKTTALEHIRTLRDVVKARREADQQQISQTEQELTVIRQTLDKTRSRMAEVEEIRQRLREEAHTDPMTGIWNKRAMTKRVNEALQNQATWPLCLIVFDIDYFKRVNDNYGHQAGDRALKAIAIAAGSVLRQYDVLFRYAGDEFVVLLPKTDLENGIKVAERVRLAAEKIKFTYKGQEGPKISITLGISQAVEGDTQETFFDRADQALLKAKKEGRNRVVAAAA